MILKNMNKKVIMLMTMTIRIIWLGLYLNQTQLIPIILCSSLIQTLNMSYVDDGDDEEFRL